MNLIRIFTLFLIIQATFCNSAIIVVNSTGGGLGTNQLCSIRAAIRAAETDMPFSACNAGSGDDTIILPGNGVFNFFEADNDDNALPSVITNIIIEGNNSVFQITDTAPALRFIRTSHNVTTGATGNLTIKNLTFKNGHPGNGSGGAIHNVAYLSLENVRFENNHAPFEGGALNCIGGYAQCIVNQSSFIGNSANYGGAINVRYGAYLELNGTILFDNEATISNGSSDGGAIFIESSDSVISNSTIAYNNATRYGGIVNTEDGIFGNYGNMQIEYSTFIGNDPLGLVGNEIYIKNSVLSGNINGNCRQFSIVTSLGYNHSDDSSCTFNNSGDVTNSPLYLDNLKVFNQYIQTYPLKYNSPAIDGADPSDCIAMDQRGMLRPKDGNNDGISRCDKGAHEMINRIIFINGFE